VGGKLRGVRRFDVAIERAGEALFVESPIDPETALGTRARVAIAGRLNDVAFEGALVPAGGRHVLFINRELATGARVKAGSRAVLWMWRVADPALRARFE
jgi:hypothetical protein